MPDEKLIDYIKENKQKGFSDEQIKKALLDAGWKQGDIDEGMKNVGSLASNIEPVLSAGRPFFLKKKLPGWVFVLAMILAAGVVLFIAWQSMIILSNIQQISVNIAELSKDIKHKQDQFADWQIYRNEEHGFEVKYPNDWNDIWIDGIEAAGILSFDELFKLVIFGAAPSAGAGSESEEFSKTFKRCRDAVLLDSISIVSKTVNTISVEIIEYNKVEDPCIYNFPGHDIAGTLALWKKNNKSGFILIDSKNQHQGDGIFNQILSNFKFIP